MNKNKLLFAISSLGLGHATRTLVVINHFLNKGYNIDIISFGNALNFLKSELTDGKVNFIEIEDYPLLERGNGFRFYYYLILDLIKLNLVIKKENNFVKNLGDKYDFIFSDGRYGIYSSVIPSFLLSHQLSFIMPKGLNILSKLTDLFNYFCFKKFTNIFIPDYEDINLSLAGKLSHPNWINKLNHTYIGILSSLNSEINGNRKIDYLFTISGYLIEYKENFINKLLEEAKDLEGKKVFILGDTKNYYKKKLENNITIYSFLSGESRKDIFLDSNIIISRAGYTTIMDLVELGKKSILFPTPNQTEQEYLSKFLHKNNLFVFGDESSNLEELVKKLKNSKIFNTKQKTKQSLLKIEKIISKHI